MMLANSWKFGTDREGSARYRLSHELSTSTNTLRPNIKHRDNFSRDGPFKSSPVNRSVTLYSMFPTETTTGLTMTEIT